MTQGFAKDFAWGVSSSSYQTEDPETDPNRRFQTDWDLSYEKGIIPFPRGNGTFSYTEFERDIAALKSLGVTHYRFSVEWARIEPQHGVFHEEAIERYVHFAKRLIEEGITPVVTLWHFTFPTWLTDFQKKARYGWLHPRMRPSWPLFVRRVVEKLAPYVRHFCPQNEPNTQSMGAFLAQLFPPRTKFNPVLYYRNMQEAAFCFRLASEIIRDLVPSSILITIQNLVYWKKSPLDPFKIFYSYAKDYNYFHLDQIAKFADWIGFTYYMGENASPLALFSQKKRNGQRVSDLGWPIQPDGLEQLIAKLTKRYQKPVIVMENGIADATDSKRQVFLQEHIEAVRKSIASGHDVRGYFHWTLIDNYEWAYGYKPKFGLFSMDEKSKALVRKGSADRFREIITHAHGAAPE